jgi:peptidoglycan/LPS O-acetylase OafA/YrhL
LATVNTFVANPADIVPAKTRTRIPALDGWRGLAILSVLFDHIQFARVRHYLRPWTQTGQHGVTIFFVLSGFLITSKLFEAGRDLRRFYLRRFFRLMPAAWTYLAAMLLLARLTHVPVTSLAEVATCVLFCRNFAAVPGFQFAGHFWSLSLEEQFYLVWPWIMLRAGARWSRWIAMSGACGVALYRWRHWAHYDSLGPNMQTQVRGDALLVGCLLALLLGEEKMRPIIGKWSRLGALPAVAMLLVCIARFHWLPPLLESIGIAALIGACVVHQDSMIARAFSFAPLARMGVISYSIYIWQALFMYLGTGTAQILRLSLGLPAFALASYYWIERPGIRLGNRLFPSQASNGDHPK